MSIEHGGPSPEEMGITPPREKPMATPSPYAAPEMHEAITQGEEPEKKDFIRAGEKQLRVGDNVLILRSNGSVEKDWQLKGFGDKFAVAEKVDAANGEIVRKVVPRGDFESWQMTLEDADKPVSIRPEGFAREIKPGSVSMKEAAQKIGIDASQPGWEDAYTKRLRELTGI